MLPVYRISEGAENLEHNYTTFSACIDIFKKNGIVLIFSEGLCKNEWHLRSLKKGTARLAISAWQQGIPLKVLPLGINYSSFRIFGKNAILNFGEIITDPNSYQDEKNLPDGKAVIDFNLKLQQQLKNLVIEAEPSDKEKIKKIFFIQQPLIKKILFFIPAIAGLILHAPLYYPVILSISVIIYFITGSLWTLLLLLIIPFSAWSLLQLKRQLM